MSVSYFFDYLYDARKFTISIEMSYKSTNLAWALTHRRLCLCDTHSSMQNAFRIQLQHGL